MYRVMLIAFLLLQLLLVVGDLWDLRRPRRTAVDQEPLRRPTLLFLLAVTGLFFSVQFAGNWLAPQPLEILESVRETTSAWNGDHVGQPISGWRAVLLGITLFYVAGLWDYLVHRFFSHHRWFWITHEYHHLPRQVMVLMPGILVRPFGFVAVALSTWATAATVYALLLSSDQPLWDLRPLLPALLVISLVLTASHSSFLRRWTRVHRVMRYGLLTTPQEHLLHHAVASHGNYGNFTTAWDRLFGTYLDPAGIDLDEVRLGLAYDQDFLGTLTMGKLRLSPAVRQKYQVARYCNLDNTPQTP